MAARRGTQSSRSPSITLDTPDISWAECTADESVQQCVDNTTFRFLDLPLEIRSLIYHLALPLSLSFHGGFPHIWNMTTAPQLFLTNRQINTEASEVFCRKAQIHITASVWLVTLPRVSIGSLEWRFQAPLSKMIAHSKFSSVRHFTIQLMGPKSCGYESHSIGSLEYLSRLKSHGNLARQIGLALQRIWKIHTLYVRIHVDHNEDIAKLFEEVWKVRNVKRAFITRSTWHDFPPNDVLRRYEELLQQKTI